MGQITWMFIKPLASWASAEELFATHNVMLPASIVSFLVRNNGASPSKSGFRTSDGKEQILNNLFDYNEGELCYVSIALDAVGEHPGLCPVGRDPFGNYICLDLCCGGVVFYDHEEDDVIGIDVSSNPELFEGLLPTSQA